MFTALFYSFSKKPNSTKRPAASNVGIPVAIELKAPTDIMNPEITISGATGITTPYQWNYCYIQEFSRYYFISNWTWTPALWTASMHVDVLATYKAEIAVSSQYVLRAAAEFDTYIEDTEYPKTHVFTTGSTLVTTGRNMTFQYQQGTFIVGVISKDATFGSVQYYMMTGSAFASLRQKMFNNISWAGSITDVSADLLKTIVNPYDYIVSVKWFPVPYSYLITQIAGNAVTEISFGYWHVTGLSDVYRWGPAALPIIQYAWEMPKSAFGTHPQASRGDYLNMSNFAEYTLNLAPYGTIKLPAALRIMGCVCRENIDLITGKSVLKFYIGDLGDYETTICMLTVETELAVNIQIAQVRSDALWNAGSSLADFIVDKFVPDGKIKNLASGITGAAREQSVTVKTGGSNGGFEALSQFGGFNADLCHVFQNIADEYNAHLGRPLCKIRSISALSGYILCSDAEIAITGTDNEAEQIINYLNTGFYYE